MKVTGVMRIVTREITPPALTKSKLRDIMQPYFPGPDRGGGGGGGGEVGWL